MNWQRSAYIQSKNEEDCFSVLDDLFPILVFLIDSTTLENGDLWLMEWVLNSVCALLCALLSTFWFVVDTAWEHSCCSPHRVLVFISYAHCSLSDTNALSCIPCCILTSSRITRKLYPVMRSAPPVPAIFGLLDTWYYVFDDIYISLLSLVMVSSATKSADSLLYLLGPSVCSFTSAVVNGFHSNGVCHLIAGSALSGDAAYMAYQRASELGKANEEIADNAFSRPLMWSLSETLVQGWPENPCRSNLQSVEQRLIKEKNTVNYNSYRVDTAGMAQATV